MLKPHAERVNATFQLMLATLAAMDRHSVELLRLRSEAKRFTSTMAEMGMNWRLDEAAWTTLPWKGYAARREQSLVTGLQRIRYDHDTPTEADVPWNDTYHATIVKQKPKAYVLPAAWSEVVARLKANGVAMHRLTRDTLLRVEQDSIADFGTVRAPYEGHYLHHGIGIVTRKVGLVVPEGSWLIPMGLPADRYVMAALEPEGEDSFFAWGFFVSVLQQKEWFSDYVFEDLAAGLLRTDPALKRALEERRAADPAFAADAFAQLYFIYQRSPWFEPGFRKHPVLRLMK